MAQLWSSLAQIKWEQLMFLGNREFECDLTPIDFARAAEAFGITAWRTDAPDSCATALDAALAHDGPALVEATVDPHEPLLPAKRIEKYVLDRAITDEKVNTNYNNFYEFGTSKNVTNEAQAHAAEVQGDTDVDTPPASLTVTRCPDGSIPVAAASIRRRPGSSAARSSMARTRWRFSML